MPFAICRTPAGAHHHQISLLAICQARFVHATNCFYVTIATKRFLDEHPFQNASEEIRSDKTITVAGSVWNMRLKELRNDKGRGFDLPVSRWGSALFLCFQGNKKQQKEVVLLAYVPNMAGHFGMRPRNYRTTRRWL